jgi:hypothetical protein
MSADRNERALARIEAALARIEAAESRPRGVAQADAPTDLQARHDRLRAAVTHSLGELDALIAEAAP